MKVTPVFLPLNQSGRVEPKATASTRSFAETLKESLKGVNDLQLTAERLDKELALGRLENIHEATIAAEKAAIALDLTVQIRNKVLEAYQEIMRMTV